MFLDFYIVRNHIKKVFLLISLIFSLLIPAFSSENEKQNESVVVIDSAKRTEYRKIQEEDVVIFTGDVKLSVKNSTQEIYIEADNVAFNRSRSTIYAEGNVVFTEKKIGKSDSKESLTASSLLFNTKTMEGVFDSARVVQESSNNLNLENGTTLIVYSELFGKENSGTVTFKNGTLTFCDDENPHWKIKASRIWLLPGNEFSFFNALLYVGNLPIFYMPFFYYPKDEMIFNPVFGYKPREGYYVQTTTYLVGRKPLQNSSTKNKDKDEDDDIALFDFMKTTELMKQEREGLFLKNTTEKDTMPKNYLKVLGDLYSNLGGMVGIDGSFNDFGIVNSLKFATYFGFSNDLFPLGDNQYSKFSPTGETYYNSSYLFGLKVPFRFYTNFQMSISKSPFSLQVDIPFYSDSLFKYDFLTRSESMDWISYFLDDNKETETSISEVNSYSWGINGSLSKPKFLSSLSPFVENLSISSISSAVNFNSKKNEDLEGENKEVSPAKKFFYPSSVYPLKLSLNFSGKILSLSSDKSSNSSKNDNSKSNKKSDILKNLENPLKLENTDEKKSENPLGLESEEETLTFIDASALPKISTTKPSITKISHFSYDLSYSLKPQFSSEINYFSEEYKSPEDIDLSNIKMSFVKYNLPFDVNSKVSVKNDFLSVTNSFNFNPVYQEHPTINEEYAKNNLVSTKNIIKSDYSSRKFDIKNTNSVKIKPFTFVDSFKDFSFSWNTAINLLTTKFNGDIENPEWEYEKAKWDADYVTKNNLSTTISANQFGNTVSESLTLTANLPPLVDSYSVSLDFKFPYLTSLRFSLGYKQKSKTDETWVFEPFTQSASLSLFDKKLSISQNFKYNIEDDYVDNFSTSVKGFGLTLSYTMSYTNPFVFSTTDGTWQIVKEKEFLPYELRLNYSSSIEKITSSSGKISLAPTLSTEFRINLVQITSSYFSFSPGIVFEINDVLKFSFSSESRNDVIFRYVQDYVDMGIEIPGEKNVFVDLFDSFAFWDEKLRYASGFKLKKLKMTLSHDLHDWTLNSSFTLEPRLIKTSKPYKYDYSPYFTLSVSWKPMSSMKTTVEDKYGEFILY